MMASLREQIPSDVIESLMAKGSQLDLEQAAEEALSLPLGEDRDGFRSLDTAQGSR